MLPKSARLNLKTSFKWVRSGRSLDDKFCRIFLREGDNQIPKIGISTSSKVFKNATDRNRSRRLLSAAVQEIYPRLSKNINIVMMPKVNIVDSTSGEISASLKNTLGLQ